MARRGSSAELSSLLKNGDGILSETVMDFLRELLERRTIKSKKHEAVSWEVGTAGISSVTCSCHLITYHKVPLISIEDFKCPQERE
jgi:hypothetical protein